MDDLAKLHWFNIIDRPSKSQTLENNFYRDLHHTTHIPLDRPVYIYHWNNNIFELENFIHTNDSRLHLNAYGLHIFLYEPLCSYLVNQNEHTQGFYSEFSEIENPNLLRADELDSIKKYVENNKLIDVTVHTCDYRVKKFYPYYTPYMKLLCDDLFLRNYTLFDNVDPTIGYQFTKKFICLNWRSTKHRHLISTYLVDKSAHLSWYFMMSEVVVKQNLWFDLDKWTDKNRVIDKLETLNNECPRIVDIEMPADRITDGRHTHWPSSNYDSPARKNPLQNTPEEFYRDSFVDIINETRFAQPTGNYSEKVYQAIKYKKPFILVAPPNTLQYVRESGFKTFSEFWDESYDNITNHEQRLSKIFDLIDFIENKSLDELQKMYNKMIDILDHNYDVLITKTPYKQAFKI